MYQHVRSCVKNCGSLSEFFESNVGLLQGEITSPILFSFFINDLENELQSNPLNCISLDQISLYLILFADDAVIMSETPDGLQSSLNALEDYCETWNLTVNVKKTKIVVQIVIFQIQIYPL